jgi:excinuclease ABC subunit A
LYAAHCMSQGQLPPFEALPCQAVGGLNNFSEVVLIDQSLPGRSSRSNPITYVKAYDEIRALFASAPKAMALGLTPGDFSFNTPGGRCERCEGLGTITIDMQFMADVTLTCPDCDGKRFGPAVLSVEWFDHSLNDVLNLSIEQALAFFKTAPKIRKKLEPLQQLGLGYLQQGNLLQKQSKRLPTLFLFEEPTKGLHLKDVHQLAAVFKTLVSAGHTLIVIEHNPDFIALGDWVIDLGPEGGEGGGQVVVCGTPKQVALSGQGHTSGFLKSFFLGAKLKPPTF